MSLDLPEPIAAYFAADKLDSDAISRCFTKDAVVKDEGHTYTGVAALQQWRANASVRYHYTSVPIHLDKTDGVTVVTCHLTGDFPGSPVDLRYFFQLERGKIANLEIRP
jgi:SnoaL-like domain